MGLISEDIIQQVTAANDIVEVISSYFPLKRAGTSWRALCPFHNEKSPSFHVNPSRQTFHCFGCGVGGTVIRFVMNYEGVDFPTAVSRLAQRVGVVITQSQEERKMHSERKRLLEIHAMASHWFHENLLRGEEEGAVAAREYLKSRGLFRDTLVKWGIGYAPNSWNAFYERALSQGFSRQELFRAGLISQREGAASARKRTSVHFYDRFRGRLIFPIWNDFGEVIGFSGRLLSIDSSSDTSQSSKYLNSPETPLFSKGRVLYGLHKSKRALIEAGEAVVCEGQIDLISCFEAGICNVVAPQGTAFTPDQARLLKRYVESVILCFDGDLAGQQAIERSLSALLTCGLTVKVVSLPAGEDPDSIIRNAGVQAFREILGEATDYFDFAINRAAAAGTLSSPSGCTSLGRKLAGFLHSMDTLALREMFFLKISTRLGISMEAFRQLFDTTKPQQTLQNKEIVQPDPPASPPLALGEGPELLCRLALVCPHTRTWLSKQNAPSVQQLLPNAALLHKIISSHVVWEDTQSFCRFLESLDSAESSKVLSWNLRKIPELPLTVAIDCWYGILRNHLKAKQELAKSKLRNKNNKVHTDEYLKIQKEFLDLQQQLQNNARSLSAPNLYKNLHH